MARNYTYQEKVFNDRIPSWASDRFMWHPAYGWFFHSVISADLEWYLFDKGFPGASVHWGERRVGKTE